MPAPLTDAAVVFLFDLLAIPFDATDRLWFFSDWVSCAPRSFDERLWDHCMAHGVIANSPTAIALGAVEVAP